MNKNLEKNEQIVVEAIKKGFDNVSVYTGEALPLREPQAISINGTISAVSNFLTKRKDVIDPKACHISVDREDKKIVLVVNEHSYYRDIITGSLSIHPDLEKWMINTGEQWTAKQAAEFIKMNRSFFADRSQAMKLSKELMNIKVKVAKEVEKSDNNRGDFKYMLAQKVISSNIPEKFVLNIPIFKGEKRQAFEVEIYISPDSFNCTFVSPELNDLIKENVDVLIDAELKKIDQLSPDIVVIEV